MFRILVVAMFSLALFAFAAPVGAQKATTRAYAPENLEPLSQRDRIRVISNEYADQSGGREIPDDQLDFYLDQVESGWQFSRIKQDIATSLRRTSEYPGNGYGTGYGVGEGRNRTIVCESQDKRPRECPNNFRGPASLTRNLSRAECVEGRSWGQRPGLIWVNQGCRGEFAEIHGGDTWEDSEYGRYSVTCASLDDRYTTCAWNGRYGVPRLVERFSRSDCIEGRTWGFRNGALWVDGGCRARFGPDFGSAYDYDDDRYDDYDG